MRFPLASLLLAALAVAPSLPAAAQPAGGGGGACRAEIQALCGDLPRGPELRACIDQNRAQLGATCRQALEERGGGAPGAGAGAGPGGAVRAACASDAQSLCPGLTPGPELRACMMEKRDQLGEACRQALATARPGQPGGGRSGGGPGGAIRAACGDDVQSLCAGIQPGGGAILRCLQENQGQLSPGCREAIASVRPRR